MDVIQQAIQRADEFRDAIVAMSRSLPTAEQAAASLSQFAASVREHDGQELPR